MWCGGSAFRRTHSYVYFHFFFTHPRSFKNMCIGIQMGRETEPYGDGADLYFMRALMFI